MIEKNFLRVAKEAQRVMDQLLSNEMQSLGSDWFAYFGEKGVLVGEGDVMVFSFYDAFISLPQVISFFSKKIEAPFGKKPEELQIKGGKNIFSEIQKINSWLKEDVSDEETVGRVLIKIHKFDEVQFYDFNREITMYMPWESFFTELPKALAKMKEQYEKIAGELTEDMSEEVEEEVEPETKKTPKRDAIPEAVRIAVWRRDEGKCAKCGSRKNLEYDHIIPVSKGGSNTERNIELLCEECNRKKRDNIE